MIGRDFKMSYARFLEENSKVYCYEDFMGKYHCCGCLLREELSLTLTRFETLKELREHLEEHVKAGHKVPESAFEQIDKELKSEESN